MNAPTQTRQQPLSLSIDRLRPVRWKIENCPPLPLWAVNTIAAIEAPVHCCETEYDQECDEEDEHNHGFFLLSLCICVLAFNLNNLPSGLARERCSFLTNDRVPEEEREKNSSELSRGYHQAITDR
jgi:hypothetical protein